MTLRSLKPVKDICRLRGIGVAERLNTSTSSLSSLIFSFCATPKRCSSSMISSPRSLKLTSLESRRCVPMTISTSPFFISAIMRLCSAGVLKRLNTSISAGKFLNRSMKVW